MTASFLKIAALALAMSSSFQANAQSQTGDPSHSAPAANSDFEQFTPRPDGSATQIEYSLWDDALDYFVLRMGPSLREGAPSVSPGMGTRRTYGHDSLYRLEGNRVVFSFLEENVKQSLTAYREDLERIGSEVDIAGLSRNEQLAYWINLHNVAVIEQIARAYPVNQPSRMEIGPEQLPLDEARFITVRGVRMSPKDIRTRIVYPNWSSPKVIYGFFRGEIGGPSIQSDAYNASNVGDLLTENAVEFVNALRGTQKRGSTLHVSKIYEEARPFYFQDWPAALRAHLAEFANAEVKEIIGETSALEASIYELDIADIANGDREPSYSNVLRTDENGDYVPQSFRITPSIARLMQERGQKMEELIERNMRTGTVTLIPIDLPGEDNEPAEVE